MRIDPLHREREVVRLFQELLELDASERGALLDGISDPDTRDEVLALLRHADEGGEFPRLVVATEVLDDALADGALDLEAGTRVGSFRIQRLLRSGGMGRVHVALQENPRRLVALKTLRRENVSPDAQRRFQVEGELLGHLHHPGIAQVYEAGVQRLELEGRRVEVPYIAMELLEDARSLVEHARERGLDLRARLDLVAQAARAIHHAHQKGVIHRDLKPDNVLVDAEGRVRIIDFGVARAAELELDASRAETLAGQVVGTPAYMSPEQLTLPSTELDTRVDVYALGAVLYELVCGRPPFETGSLPLAGLARKIVDDGPARPRSLSQEVPPDVEAVLLKAMARDRAQRYASAAALAEDLERFLRHESIEARSPTLFHQLRLFARRNRLFTASILVAVLSLVAATGVSLAFGLAARRAEAQERQARERGDQLLQQVFDTNFALVFDFAEGIAQLSGSTELRVAMLHSAMERLADLEDEARRRPPNLVKLANAYLRLGVALGAHDRTNLGDLDGAAEAYARARDLLQGAEGHDIALTLTWMEVEEALGDAERGRANPDTALVHYEASLELAEAAVAERPDDLALRERMLRRKRDIGLTYTSKGETERGLAIMEEVLEGFGELLALDPGNESFRFHEANAWTGVGMALYVAERHDEAIETLGEALARMEDLSTETPSNRNPATMVVQIRHPLSEALIKAGRPTESLAEIETALSLVEELTESDPDDAQARRFRGVFLMNGGWAAHERATAARESGSAATEIEADLLLSEEYYRAALDFWLAERAAGRLYPFEGKYITGLEERLARVARDLGTE